MHCHFICEEIYIGSVVSKLKVALTNYTGVAGSVAKYCCLLSQIFG